MPRFQLSFHSVFLLYLWNFCQTRNFCINQVLLGSDSLGQLTWVYVFSIRYRWFLQSTSGLCLMYLWNCVWLVQCLSFMPWCVSFVVLFLPKSRQTFVNAGFPHLYFMSVLVIFLSVLGKSYRLDVQWLPLPLSFTILSFTFFCTLIFFPLPFLQKIPCCPFFLTHSVLHRPLFPLPSPNQEPQTTVIHNPADGNKVYSCSETSLKLQFAATALLQLE